MRNKFTLENEIWFILYSFGCNVDLNIKTLLRFLPIKDK